LFRCTAHFSLLQIPVLVFVSSIPGFLNPWVLYIPWVFTSLVPQSLVLENSDSPYWLANPPWPVPGSSFCRSSPLSLLFNSFLLRERGLERRFTVGAREGPGRWTLARPRRF